MASNGVAVGAPWEGAGARPPAGGTEGGGGGGGRGTMQLLSAAEREFVTRGVEQGVRPDGRERLESRSIHLELGVIPSAFGSAQAQCGGTKVLAAVKAEIVAPNTTQPGGRIEASVSCTLTASPLFQGQRGEEVAAELTMAMNRMLQGSLPAATRHALSISPGICRMCCPHTENALSIYNVFSLDRTCSLCSDAQGVEHVARQTHSQKYSLHTPYTHTHTHTHTWWSTFGWPG